MSHFSIPNLWLNFIISSFFHFCRANPRKNLCSCSPFFSLQEEQIIYKYINYLTNRKIKLNVYALFLKLQAKTAPPGYHLLMPVGLNLYYDHEEFHY